MISCHVLQFRRRPADSCDACRNPAGGKGGEAAAMILATALLLSACSSAQPGTQLVPAGEQRLDVRCPAGTRPTVQYRKDLPPLISCADSAAAKP